MKYRMMVHSGYWNATMQTHTIVTTVVIEFDRCDLNEMHRIKREVEDQNSKDGYGIYYGCIIL